MPTNETKADDDQRETPSSHTTSTSRRRLLHLLGGGATAGLAGCSGESGQGTATGTETGTGTATEIGTGEELQKSATIGIPRNVTEDWQAVYGVTPYWARVLEPLTWVTADFKAAPWLAKDWKRTGEKTWEFYLREDVTFHNGDPLNADAVVFSLRKFLTEPSFAKLLQDFAQLKPEGVEKIDDMTVKLNNTGPLSLMPERLTHLFFVIQHPNSSKEQKWGNVIGTEPYKEKELKPDDRLIVSAYDEYWREPPQMEELTYRFIEDDNTRALALTGGQIDVGMDLSPSRFDILNNAKNTDAIAQTTATTGTLHFNNTNPPVNDVKLRKALNYAVSQKKIVEGALNGIGEPAKGLVPPIMWFSAHDSLPAYGPNKSKAKQLIEESDYNGETLKLIANQQSTLIQNPKLIAQVFQQQAKNVGVPVEIQMLEGSGYSEAENTGGGGHIFLSGEFTSHASGTDMFETYDTRYNLGPPWEFDKKTEEKLASLLEKARSATNPEVAKDAYGQAERLLIVQEAILIPLYYQKYIVGTKANVMEFDWHPLKLYNRMEKFKQMK